MSISTRDSASAVQRSELAAREQYRFIIAALTAQRKSKKPPQFAKQGMMVSALIETSAPICIEKFDDYKMLGRFTLRDEGMFFFHGA